MPDITTDPHNSSHSWIIRLQPDIVPLLGYNLILLTNRSSEGKPRQWLEFSQVFVIYPKQTNTHEKFT